MCQLKLLLIQQIIDCIFQAVRHWKIFYSIKQLIATLKFQEHCYRRIFIGSWILKFSWEIEQKSAWHGFLSNLSKNTLLSSATMSSGQLTFVALSFSMTSKRPRSESSLKVLPLDESKYSNVWSVRPKIIESCAHLRNIFSEITGFETWVVICFRRSILFLIPHFILSSSDSNPSKSQLPMKDEFLKSEVIKRNRKWEYLCYHWLQEKHENEVWLPVVF